MSTMEEPQLFGAGRGDVTGVHVSYETYDTGTQTVSVWVHTKMRQRPMWLRISGRTTDNMDPIITSTVPLIHRGSHMGGDLARRTLWALHNRWGRDGFEVELTGGGKPPH